MQPYITTAQLWHAQLSVAQGSALWHMLETAQESSDQAERLHAWQSYKLLDNLEKARLAKANNA